MNVFASAYIVHLTTCKWASILKAMAKGVPTAEEIKSNTCIQRDERGFS